MSDAVTASLQAPRYEVIPIKGVEGQLAFLPPGATVTVTGSPTRGVAPTIALAARLAATGHHAVPHIPARLVGGPDHLRAILTDLQAAGIDEIFVPAGDAETPAGPYAAAGDLLEEMAGLGHHLRGIGITGYPESHAFIPDATTISEMARKARYATTIVSQICYEPARIRAWVAAVRDRGIELPIHLGIPGVIDRSKLLRVSLRVGLGDSIRYLRKQHDVATHLLAGYTPDELVGELVDLFDDPGAGVVGWHLFTFNEVERTVRWRQELLTTVRGAVL